VVGLINVKPTLLDVCYRVSWKIVELQIASDCFNFTITPFADLIVVVALLKRVIDRNLSPLKISLRDLYECETSNLSFGLVLQSISTSIANDTLYDISTHSISAQFF